MIRMGLAFLNEVSEESRGFGFVMMESREEAQAAIDQLSGQNVEGKSITVAHVRSFETFM